MVDQAIKILRGIKKDYETFHNVQYPDETIVKAVKLSKRYGLNIESLCYDKVPPAVAAPIKTTDEKKAA